MLTREELKSRLVKWNEGWRTHDLEVVMDLFHDEILFENWTGGAARGKNALRKAWEPWFRNHGGFLFTEEDTFIDEAEQKVLFRWRLDWPSGEKGWEGRPESRRGVDVMYFKDGKIIGKFTYSKTTIEIDGEKVKLTAPAP